MSKLRLILGAALLVLGGLIMARGIHYSTQHDVANVGGVRVSVDEQKPIPTWAGGLIALAGIVMVFTGAARRP